MKQAFSVLLWTFGPTAIIFPGMEASSKYPDK